MIGTLGKLLVAASLLGLAAVASADPVDINRASAKEMASALEGVGKARAEAIVRYRENNGPFGAVDELVRVDGIGKGIVDMNRNNLRVNAPDVAG